MPYFLRQLWLLYLVKAMVIPNGCCTQSDYPYFFVISWSWYFVFQLSFVGGIFKVKSECWYKNQRPLKCKIRYFRTLFWTLLTAMTWFSFESRAKSQDFTIWYSDHVVKPSLFFLSLFLFLGLFLSSLFPTFGYFWIWRYLFHCSLSNNSNNLCSSLYNQLEK